MCRLLHDQPLTALITLFTHVLGDPTSPSAPTDIALMEVVTGLFGRLEFYTSGIVSLTGISEFARLARTAVRMAKETTRKSEMVTSSRQPELPPPPALSPQNTDQNPSSTRLTSTEGINIEDVAGLSSSALDSSFFDSNCGRFGSTTIDGHHESVWPNWDMIGTIPEEADFPISADMALNSIFAFGTPNMGCWNMNEQSRLLD